MLPSLPTRAKPQRQLIDNASHSRVGVAIFVVGTEKHLGTQQPASEPCGIAALELVALALRVAAERVGQNVGFQQVEIGGRIPFHAVFLSIRVGGLSPHRSTVRKAQKRLHASRRQQEPTTFLHHESLALPLPTGLGLELRER